MIQRRTFATANELALNAAADLDTHVSRLLESKPQVDLVVTGGTVGIITLEKLAPLWVSRDLKNLHIWWGDERFVAESSQDRNYVQAEIALISKLNIPSENIHSMPSDKNQGLEVAGEEFANELEHAKPHFDVVLLGMGPDAHVASLFPNSQSQSHGNWVVTESNSPKPPSQRISLSYEALNSADEVWFLVSGEDKADAVSRVFSNEDLPGTKVKGQLATIWYLDQAAAAKLIS